MARWLKDRRRLTLMIAAWIVLSGVWLAPAGRPSQNSFPQVDAATIVRIEEPKVDDQVWGVVKISGWAADPEAPSGTGVKGVSIWLNGPPDEGEWLGDALYGVTRTDVGSRLQASRFAPSGFYFEWDTATRGAAGPASAVIWVAAKTVNDEWVAQSVGIALVAPPAPPTPSAGPAQATSPWVSGQPSAKPPPQPRSSSQSSRSSSLRASVTTIGPNLVMVEVRGLSPGEQVTATLYAPNGAAFSTSSAVADSSGVATFFFNYNSGYSGAWSIIIYSQSGSTNVIIR